MKIFEWQANKWIYDSISGTTLTNTGVFLKNTLKGQAGYFNDSSLSKTWLSISNKVALSFSFMQLKHSTASVDHLFCFNSYYCRLAIKSAQSLVFYVAGAWTSNIDIAYSIIIWKQYHIYIETENIWSNCNISIYINWLFISSWTATWYNFATLTDLYIWRWVVSWYWLIGNIYWMKVYNSFLSQAEINNEYKQFLSLQPIQPPKTNFVYPKPYQLRETWLVVWYNMQYTKGKVYDISGNLKNGTVVWWLYPTKNGIKSNWTNWKLTLWNIWNVKSVCMRIKLNSTTEKIMEWQANSKLMYSASWTLTASDFATKYINWVAGTTTVAWQWMNVVFTSSSDVSFSACTLFLNNATYWNFEIEDLRMYSIELTLQQAKIYNNQFAKRVVLEDNFSFDKAYWNTVVPRWWIAGTGSYKLVTELTGDSIIKKGANYLQCTWVWTISFPCKQAYWTWEWSWYKWADTNAIKIWVINNNNIDPSASTNDYTFNIDNTEAILFRRFWKSNIMVTVASYIANLTWYRTKITRSAVWSWTIYIKWWAFTNWTAISTSWWSWTNPSTDNTYTISNFLWLTLSVWDRIADIVIKEWIEV